MIRCKGWGEPAAHEKPLYKTLCGMWIGVSDELLKTETEFTDGMCPECAAVVREERKKRCGERVGGTGSAGAFPLR
jgi:hypothetical protein